MNRRTNLMGLFAALLGRQRAMAPSLERSPSSNTSSESSPVREERRASPRRYGDPVEVHLRSYEYLDPPCGRTGWVRDRSAGGLGLTTEKPLEVGSWLRVRPDFGSGRRLLGGCPCAPLPAPRRKWVLGCQFVEPPPHELLLLFR